MRAARCFAASAMRRWRDPKARHGSDRRPCQESCGDREGAKAGEIGAQVVTRKRRNTVSYERGSANVYSDLGYRGAGDMLVKAKLVSRIAELLAEHRLTQTRAARLLGVPQPKLSKMLRGQFRGVSERDRKSVV